MHRDSGDYTLDTNATDRSLADLQADNAALNGELQLMTDNAALVIADLDARIAALQAALEGTQAAAADLKRENAVVRQSRKRLVRFICATKQARNVFKALEWLRGKDPVLRVSKPQ